MKTTTNPTHRSDPTGQIYYDADCAWCRGIVQRWAHHLRSSGFEPMPLQTPGAAERLGVTPVALMASMHLLTVDGRRFAGADAVVEMARARAWTRPLAWIAAVPGVMLVLRRIYAAIAARRHCLAGTCPVQIARGQTPSQKHKRARAFLELP